MSSDEARKRREEKQGRLSVAQQERVRADARAYADRWAEVPLLPGIVQGGAALPDDDKPKGPGRPVGARATAPAEYRRHILATKGDFLGRLAGIANTDTLQLAKVLDCTPLEALNAQAKLAAIAAPYVYTPQARPPEELAAGYWAGMVFAAASGAKPGTMDTLAALAGRPPDMQEIQAVSAVEFAASEPGSENDEDKAP